MARYLNRMQIVSREGVPSGYFAGCTAYLENGRLSVMLRRRRDSRPRRLLPVGALDPPTIEVDDPKNCEGFVPRAAVAI
jgi:hypothetical protein